jgi:hypothetical protein
MVPSEGVDSRTFWIRPYGNPKYLAGVQLIGDNASVVAKFARLYIKDAIDAERKAAAEAMRERCRQVAVANGDPDLVAAIVTLPLED